MVDGAAVVLGVVGLAEAGWRAGLWRALGATTAGWVDWAWSFHRVAWTMMAAAAVYHGVCTVLWQRTPASSWPGCVSRRSTAAGCRAGWPGGEGCGARRRSCRR